MTKIEERLKELETICEEARRGGSVEQVSKACIKHRDTANEYMPKLIQALREAAVCLDNMKRARERDQSGAPRLSLIDVSAFADNTLTRIEALLTEGK